MEQTLENPTPGRREPAWVAQGRRRVLESVTEALERVLHARVYVDSDGSPWLSEDHGRPTVHQLAVLERMEIRLGNKVPDPAYGHRQYFDVDIGRFRVLGHAFRMAPDIPVWLRTLIIEAAPGADAVVTYPEPKAGPARISIRFNGGRSIKRTRARLAALGIRLRSVSGLVVRGQHVYHGTIDVTVAVRATGRCAVREEEMIYDNRYRQGGGTAAGTAASGGSCHNMTEPHGRARMARHNNTIYGGRA